MGCPDSQEVTKNKKKVKNRLKNAITAIFSSNLGDHLFQEKIFKLKFFSTFRE